MSDKAWKAAERAAAELSGGERTWDSKLDIDVIAPTENPEWAIEVKERRAMSVAELEGWLRENAAKAARHDPPLKPALIIKRKGGRGRETPWLAVFPLT